MEQKNYSYEMQTIVKPSSPIKEVVFLTPARVVLENNVVAIVDIDLVNRKAYQGSNEWRSKEIFEFLDEVNSIPADFYASQETNQELMDQCNQLKQELL